MLKVGRLNRSLTRTMEKVGCVLDLPLKYLDGATFMSKDAYGHLCTKYNHAHWTLEGWSFDGTDDYINCGNDSSLDITDAITIEARVKADTLVGDRVFMGKYGASGNRTHLLYYYSGGNRYSLYLVDEDGNTKDAFSPTAPILGIWQHLIATYDKSYLTVYLDRVAGTPVAWDKTLDISTANLWVGSAVGYNRPFDGSIDEVRIYNQAEYASKILQRAIEARKN